MTQLSEEDTNSVDRNSPCPSDSPRAYGPVRERSLNRLDQRNTLSLSADSTKLREPKSDNARQELQFSESLTHDLRVVQPRQSLSLVSQIRGGSPCGTRQSCLDQEFADLASSSGHLGLTPQLAATTREVKDTMPITRRRRHRTGHISDLLSPPLLVPARPWTTITNDDDLVSHLVSL